MSELQLGSTPIQRTVEHRRTQTGDVLALSKAYRLTEGDLRDPPIPGSALPM